MKKKSKADISDFSWFNLNNYKFIDDLTANELLEELEQRLIAFQDLEKLQKNSITDTQEVELPDNLDIPLIEMPDLENELLSYPELNSLVYEDVIRFVRILKGDPNLSKDSNMDIELRNHFDKIYPPDNYIASLPLEIGCVQPLNFTDLYLLDRDTRILGVYDHDEQGKTTLRNSKYICASVDDVLSNNRGLFHASLDLKNATDEQILISLRHLLPLWREKVDIPEPQTNNESVKQKLRSLKSIYNYKILPILDVLLWGGIYNKEISNPLLGTLIFFDEPKDTQAIKETIRPFAFIALQDDFIRSLSFFLKKDGELGSSKVSDLMRRKSVI